MVYENEKQPSTYYKLKEAIDKIKIIDTHEHLVQEKQRLEKTPDLFEMFLSHYASSDLVSSGMSYEELNFVRNPKIPIEERFKVFKPYWERIQNTGYARAINVAIKGLYSVNKIDETTYKELSSRILEANKPGIYRWILKEKALIEISILDALDARVDFLDVDGEFFALVKRFDSFVTIGNRKDIEELERRYGSQIHSFHDLIQVLERKVKEASNKIVGIKTGLAYERPLLFKEFSENEAEEVFKNIYNQEKPERLGFEELRPYQDFIFHKIVQLAGRSNLPMQIHVGLQEGNDNTITNSNPTLLIDLFRKYKEVRFDLFHGAYPYVGELSAIAKNFQNVYINMCWLHVISPHMARVALSEWLDAVPANKIFGFGGDYLFAEGVYGHAVIARENIARVLSEKVEEGTFSETEAIKIADMLLRENAKEFYFSRRLSP
ncbi:MAG: amidohydrolase family protein [Thermoproteota archaeon]|jgi:predicted TIM-barrel fold metal-dependent hydrolase